MYEGHERMSTDRQAGAIDKHGHSQPPHIHVIIPIIDLVKLLFAEDRK